MKANCDLNVLTYLTKLLLQNISNEAPSNAKGGGMCPMPHDETPLLLASYFQAPILK